MTNSLSSRILELTPQQLGRLNEEEIFTLREAARQERYDNLDARCSRAALDEKGWARTDSGPLFWGQNLTKTIDDHALAKGTPSKASFPRKSYFQVLMGELLQPVIHLSTGCRTTLICKSREMLSSWTICLYLAWLCQWRPGTTAVVQTLKETKAEELIRYIAILAEQQEPFLKERHPISRSVAMEIEWQNGSRAFGIPGGETQIRMFHPFVAVFDEMAFMEDAQACHAAVLPVAKQIIGVSSSHASWFGDQCMDTGPMKVSEPEPLPKIELARANYPYPIDRRGHDPQGL
jgi:hypothetical protein